MTVRARDVARHLAARDRPAREGFAHVHAVTAGLIQPAKEDREGMLAAPVYFELPQTGEAWEVHAAEHMRQARRDNPALDATLAAAERGEDRRGPSLPEGVTVGEIRR